MFTNNGYGFGYEFEKFSKENVSIGADLRFYDIRSDESGTTQKINDNGQLKDQSSRHGNGRHGLHVGHHRNPSLNIAQFIIAQKLQRQWSDDEVTKCYACEKKQ